MSNPTFEVSGGAAWAVKGAHDQRDQNNAAAVDNLLGRRPSAIPSHLSRVLYVPKHGSSQSHLPLYDVSDEFAKSVGDVPIGSTLFSTRLAMMKTPSGDGTDGDVRYLVDFEKHIGDTEEVEISVSKRSVGGPNSDAGMQARLTTDDEGFKLSTLKQSVGHGEVPVTVSYPIADSVVRDNKIRHPFFTFSDFGNEQLQWQTHPKEHGPLRHSLIETSPAQAPDDIPHDENVRAIFHHVWNNALPASTQQSEGILIIPEDIDSQIEGLYVASLIGLLWRLRGLSGEATEGSGSKHRASKVLKKIFRKD